MVILVDMPVLWKLVALSGLPCLALALPTPAHGQVLPPVSEAELTTATLSPEEDSELDAATTVITREEIEQLGAVTVLEVLRLVPGLDVVRFGSEGSCTSVFLRGSNSTHVLVLVDGVRVNSPYLSGYDFSTLTTENVERIEIVRGPLSALYGPDALGGVIQVFTRSPTSDPSLQATLEAGNADQRQGSFSGSAGTGPFSAIATYRDARVDADRENASWRERNGSLRLEGRTGDRLHVTLEASVLDSEVGTPGPVGQETPRARREFREERIALPVAFKPSEGHRANVVVARVASKPIIEDPGIPFFSRTDARALQGRASDTWEAANHTMTVLGSWERWEVSDRNSSGTTLDDERTTIWGLGFRDAVVFGFGWAGSFAIRYDRHGEFGGHWSPRAAVSWLSPDGQWKARASAGAAFRAPSVGELFLPVFGNPDLEPERSQSYEIGLERYTEGGRAQVSLFWNEFRELIALDTLASSLRNIGRARARGVEVAWGQKVSKALAVDAGYTYLDAENRSTGQMLRWRPRHRAFVAVVARPIEALRLAVRGTFVGRRDDLDPVTFMRAEDPSYARIDLFARYGQGHMVPYFRVENATDREYEEAKGFPAPRRRYAVGLEVTFRRREAKPCQG